MKFSIYTSLFNYSPEKFDIVDAFENWFKYGDEIVVATFEDQKFQIESAIKESFGYDERVKIKGVKDTNLDDPFFDGKLKNAALQACSNEVVIQQDFDERLGGDKKQWEYLGDLILNQFGPPFGFLIPTIDLYKDLDHYKSIGAKWYLTSKEGVYRGPVNFAKRGDGTINTNFSDTCEAITAHGELINYLPATRFEQELDIKFPHSVHLGYLDINKRIENNKFWSKIWSARNGEEVPVATTKEQLESENKAIPHGLPREWWK